MINIKDMVSIGWLIVGVAIFLGVLFPDGDAEAQERLTWFVVAAICVATSNIIVLMPWRD